MQILLRADMARLTQDLNNARRTVSSAMDDIGGAVKKAMGLLASFGVGLGIAELAHQVIDAQREFDKLNAGLVTATGSTQNAAKAFAALQAFAASTPFSVAEATEAFIKLRNLGLTPSEASLRSYGNTASAMGKGLNQLIEAVADAATGEFERLKEFGIKSAVTGDQVAFTFKGVTKMVQNNAKDIEGYLKALGDVDFAGGMERRAATLDGAISNLGDAWAATLRTIASNGIGDAILGGVLALSGALGDLSAILDAVGGAARKEGEQVKEASVLHQTLTAIFETVAVLGTNVFYVLTQVGNEMGGLAAQAVAVAHGDFAGAKAISEQMKTDADEARKNVDAKTDAILGAAKKQQDAQDKAAAARKANNTDELAEYAVTLTAEEKRNQAKIALIATEQRITGVNAESLADLKKLQTALDTGAITQERYNYLKGKLGEQMYQNSQAGKDEVKQLEKSSAAVKQRADQQAILNSRYQSQLAFLHDTNQLNDVDFITKNGAAEVKALEDQKASQQALLSLANKKHQNQVEQATLAGQIAATQDKIDSKEIENKNKLLKLEHDQYTLAANNYADVIDNARAEAKTQQDALRDQNDVNSQLGMTERQIAAVNAARLNDMAARADENALIAENIDWSGQLSQAYRDQADALRQRAVALTDGAELKAQKEIWTSIESTAHDTFVSIFDSGKSAFDRLRDTLKNGLLDLLYQMVVKKWVLSIGASVGLTGASGIAAAADATGATGSSGATGLIGLAQSASSLYKVVSGGFASLSTSVADAVQLGFDNTGLASVFSSAAPSVDLATGITSNGAAAGLAGSAASIAAGAVAGILGGKLISGQYGSNATVGAGTAVGAIAGSIVPGLGTALGAAVGGLLGGIANRLFGMGDKEVTSTGISGTLSASGVSATNYSNWKQDGGWFRSDKSGTDKTALDPAVIAQFTQGFAAIKTATAGFATSVGASVDSLSTYSKTFDIALTGDATANQTAITNFFSTMGDEIALRLVPNLADFSKSGETMSATLERLAGDFDATNQVATLLGTNATSMFGSLGIDSAAARERLIDLSGGISTLTSEATAFNQNYLTDAERLKPVADAVSAAMASLGLASVTTREQFKEVVQGLDVTTAAGAQEFASLMALSDAFAQVTPAIDATATAARSASDILSEQQDLQKQLDQLTLTSTQLRAKERLSIDASNLALFDQITYLQTITDTSSALKTSISSLDAFRKSIMSFSDSQLLGSLSPLTAMQKDAAAKSQYETMLAQANAGDETARAGIQAAATAFLTADQVVNASSSAYVANFTKVQGDLATLAAITGTQMSDAQAQLDALDQQVSQLATLNATASGIASAIATSDWSAVGTTDMSPLVDEIKGLRDDNASLKADNAALLTAINNQTAAVVSATLTAAANNAAAVTAGAAETAAASTWAAQITAEVAAK